MNPFLRSGTADEYFDDADAFVPETVPDPGPFLEGQDVLESDRHVATHAIARDLFEERGVYDATFGYNLAKLNLDRRHPDAGFRYAIEDDTRAVLRAEFTPTTAFCPQADSLTKGAFRAWNGLADRHEYELVRIRIHPMANPSESINRALERAEERFRETGTLEDDEPAAPPF